MRERSALKHGPRANAVDCTATNANTQTPGRTGILPLQPDRG